MGRINATLKRWPKKRSKGDQTRKACIPMGFQRPGFLDTSSRCVISTHTIKILISQSGICRVSLETGCTYVETSSSRSRAGTMIALVRSLMVVSKRKASIWRSRSCVRARPFPDAGAPRVRGFGAIARLLREPEGPRHLPFVAVPVALSKIFRHSCIYIRTDAGIRTPQDLRGKRVGTTQLGSTATIFMNGMLQHEYGVTMDDIHWFIGGLTTPTQRPLIPLKLPEKIKVEFLPSDRTLEGMLESGDLDALLAIFIPPSFRRARLA